MQKSPKSVTDHEGKALDNAALVAIIRELMTRKQEDEFVCPIADPEIEKSFVCSTCHITAEDNKRLEKEKEDELSSILMYKYEYGYRLYVGDLPDEYIAEYRAAGLSDELCNLLRIAYQLDCKWLVLDCDGSDYEELPSFDW